MNLTSSVAEAAFRVFDGLSQEIQKSAEDDNFIEELEEFLKIMNNNEIVGLEFYKHLDFRHEDEDCAISSTLLRV